MAEERGLAPYQSMAYKNWFQNYMTCKHCGLLTATEWPVQLQTASIQIKFN